MNWMYVYVCECVCVCAYWTSYGYQKACWTLSASKKSSIFILLFLLLFIVVTLTLNDKTAKQQLSSIVRRPTININCFETSS